MLRNLSRERVGRGTKSLPLIPSQEGNSNFLTLNIYKMKLNPIVGIIVTLLVGTGLLGALIISKKDEIKQGSDIVEIASKLGMDADQFIADFESEEVANTVESQRVDALDRLGGTASTPTVFINNELFERQVAGDIEENIKLQIASSKEANSEIKLPIKVEIFEDYNCPHCAEFQDELHDLIEAFDSKDVDFQLKHLPFLKDSSERYAKAAEAARKQDKFYEYSLELYMMLHPGTSYEFYPEK